MERAEIQAVCAAILHVCFLEIETEHAAFKGLACKATALDSVQHYLPYC